MHIVTATAKNIDAHDFPMCHECFQVLINLRKNNHILITKPDNCSSAVILNMFDYMGKMNQILNDESKLQCLGPTELNDNTAKIEAKLETFT